MAGMYTRDTIENWVSDFVVSDGMRAFSSGMKEIAGEVLVAFLEKACAVRDVEPAEVEEADVKTGLLEGVVKLAVPEGVRREVPAVCGAFLAYLESAGRLSGGRAMGAFVGALGGAYEEAGSGKVKPIVRAGSKIGRNDPCPCGSGKKYKKCCMGE